MGDKVKVRPLDAETQETLIKLFRALPRGFARFGEGGYLLPPSYEENADNLKAIPVRADDVWVVAIPRSGTTWTQELVWLLVNDHDYETALKIPLEPRYFIVRPTSKLHEDILQIVDDEEEDEYFKKPRTLQQLSEAPSPRFVKTHLPLSLLPDDLLDTTKVVYVARDPRDVAVSLYHLSKFFKFIDYVGDFKTFWNLFVTDSMLRDRRMIELHHNSLFFSQAFESNPDNEALFAYTPFFPHLKEAWARRDHPNMLFIFYEELQQNLSASIERIAKFLGKEVTSEQIQKLCEHLDIKNFKNNASVNPPRFQRFANPGEEGFVRNGKSRGWREHFDEEMAAQAQRWMRAQLADTDLRFPVEPAPK